MKPERPRIITIICIWEVIVFIRYLCLASSEHLMGPLFLIGILILSYFPYIFIVAMWKNMTGGATAYIWYQGITAFFKFTSGNFIEGVITLFVFALVIYGRRQMIEENRKCY